MKSNAIKKVSLSEDAEQLAEMRILLRRAFYRDLGRRVPLQLKSIPSYVRAVKRQFNLSSGNQARAMLAQVEGFQSWQSLMAAMLKELN